MATEVEPIPGNWYINRASGARFWVMSIDEDERTVQIQHENADLDEYPLDAWYRMSIDYSEPELDATAPTSDTEEARNDLSAEDPDAAQLPDQQERYRREYVDYAGKSAKGFPEPRPGRDPNDKFERGSEMGLEQWPETQERPPGS